MASPPFQLLRPQIMEFSLTPLFHLYFTSNHLQIISPPPLEYMQNSFTSHNLTANTLVWSNLLPSLPWIIIHRLLSDLTDSTLALLQSFHNTKSEWCSSGKSVTPTWLRVKATVLLWPKRLCTIFSMCFSPSQVPALPPDCSYSSPTCSFHSSHVGLFAVPYTPQVHTCLWPLCLSFLCLIFPPSHHP